MTRIALIISVVLVGCVGPERALRSSARTDLGVAYFREGAPEDAVSALEEAVRLDPRNWRAHNALAVVYIAKGRPELAEASFRRALGVAPDEAEVLVSFGTYLVRNGRLDEGLEAYGAALRDLDYRNPAVVHSNLAYALTLARSPDDAVSHAREAIRRAPDLCEAHYNLGLALEARGDPLGAMEAYRRQVEVCPNESIGARLRLGCVQFSVGMREEGAAVLDTVAAAAPQSVFADRAHACVQGRTVASELE